MKRTLTLVVASMAALLFAPTSSSQSLQEAFTQGAAIGRAGNAGARAQITGDNAQRMVPGASSSPAQASYFGSASLGPQAAAAAQACAIQPAAATFEAQACQAANFSRTNPLRRPNFTIGQDDALLARARGIAANPQAIAGNLAGTYSGCTVQTTSLASGGYALANGLVVPATDLDVGLFAPRMGGDAIRERFLAGRGYLSYVGVEQDVTGTAWTRLLAIAAGAGSLRQGALEMSAREEAVLDLYVEQACGPWLGAAILSAFHVGVEAGLSPLGLLLEMYLSGEMSETFSQMARDGFLSSSRAHGYAAAFGGMTRTFAIDREGMAAHMREVLTEIENGGFARALQDEFEAGYPCRAFIEQVIGEDDLLSRTEAAFRAM